jgi:hypothetical protein
LILGFGILASAITTGHGDDIPTCDSVGDAPFFKNRIDGVQLEKTTLEEIVNQFGQAHRFIEPQAECCLQVGVCYVSPDRRIASLFGGWKDSPVTSYEITNDPDTIASYKNCVTAESLSGKLASSTGVALGMTRANVIQRLGKPDKMVGPTGENLEFRYRCRRTDLGPDWVTHVLISIRFTNDKVVYLQVTQSTQG